MDMKWISAWSLKKRDRKFHKEWAFERVHRQ